jgi:flagellar biosynthesis/type III secretory pathway protein FliH
VIEKEKITPEERARMKDEYNQEDAEKQSFKKGQNEGWKNGKDEGLKEGKEKMYVGVIPCGCPELQFLVLKL